MGASAGVPYPLWDALRHARTLNKLPITGRFSDLRPTKEPFPFKKNSGTTSFGLPIYRGKRLQRRDRHGFSPCSLFCNQIFHFKRTNTKYQGIKKSATEKIKKFTLTPIFKKFHSFHNIKNVVFALIFDIC